MYIVWYPIASFCMISFSVSSHCWKVVTRLDIVCLQMKLLEEKPGSEESILQHLLQLTSKEGMCLPRCTANTTVSASTLSINTATDDAEHANLNLWNDICMKLRKYFIDKLSKLPVATKRNEKPVIRALGDERLRYLQSLCSLFPPDNIWLRYKSLRIHQLDARLLCSKSGQAGKDMSFLRIVSHMSEELLPTLETMISEDYEVSVGCMHIEAKGKERCKVETKESMSCVEVWKNVRC